MRARNPLALLPLVLLFLPLDAYAFGKKPADTSTPAPAPAPAPKPTPQPTPAPPPEPGSSIPSPGTGSNFTSCFNKIGGSWAFGSSPSACNVSPAQSTNYALAQYAPVIFHDGAASRTPYMNSLFALAREVGTYYLHRRNPNASSAELAGFLSGFYTLLHQESFWTHYRLGNDSVLRYMRGDVLHGYGIMQVDDRSHSVALNQGKGVDLVENMIYGLDIYYAAWVRSASASCVSSSTNWESRARSAWSAYNGGPSSICRWSNPNSASADKDVAYISKFRAKGWLANVPDQAKATTLNVTCLAEGSRPCANIR